MYIQQVELTRGVSNDFVKALTSMSVKEEHAQGTILFRKGEPANHAYLLLIGRVHLKMGETGHVVHIVSRPGETFGWSSLVDRDVFSATAECVQHTCKSVVLPKFMSKRCQHTSVSSHFHSSPTPLLERLSYA